MSPVSDEVATVVAASYLLTEHVGGLTDVLERETDTALLALHHWAYMPVRRI